MSNTAINTVRDLNDRFRKGDRSVPGETFITRGVNAMIEADGASTLDLLSQVRNFSNFNVDNDPWSEHDFGSFTFQGAICFWKIDVYDHALKWAAPDPADPKLSKRVLTIMLASEY